jgi:hypothetical protein
LQSIELEGVPCARQTSEVIPVALLRLRDRAHCSAPSAPVPTSMSVASPGSPGADGGFGARRAVPAAKAERPLPVRSATFTGAHGNERDAPVAVVHVSGCAPKVCPRSCHWLPAKHRPPVTRTGMLQLSLLLTWSRRLGPSKLSKVISHTVLPDQTERRLIGRLGALWPLAVDHCQRGYEANVDPVRRPASECGASGGDL